MTPFSIIEKQMDFLYEQGKKIDEEHCETCNGEGKIEVANGPDNFELKRCPDCNLKGDENI